jgi:FixJ family two-component response regulator
MPRSGPPIPNMLMPIIHIVDDDASFRTSLERRLRRAGYNVVQYSSAQELLDHLPDESATGCILLDVRIPGLSGLELQARLTELGHTLLIIFLSGFPNVQIAVKAIKAGAEDFLTKPVASEQLLGTISQAIAHHERLRDERSRHATLQARLGTLTPREHQVFELVVQGKINKQIAYQLGAAVRTIKAHRHRIVEKMGVQSLAELVSTAELLGVLRRRVGDNLVVRANIAVSHSPRARTRGADVGNVVQFAE